MDYGWMVFECMQICVMSDQIRSDQIRWSESKGLLSVPFSSYTTQIALSSLPYMKSTYSTGRLTVIINMLTGSGYTHHVVIQTVMQRYK